MDIAVFTRSARHRGRIIRTLEVPWTTWPKRATTWRTRTGATTWSLQASHRWWGGGGGGLWIVGGLRKESKILRKRGHGHRSVGDGADTHSGESHRHSIFATQVDVGADKCTQAEDFQRLRQRLRQRRFLGNCSGEASSTDDFTERTEAGPHR